jgi:hypothetical protein
MENPFGPLFRHVLISPSLNWHDPVPSWSKMAAETVMCIKTGGEKHQLPANYSECVSDGMENPFGPLFRHGLLTNILEF